MPYVERKGGTVISLYYGPVPGIAEEFLEDIDPEVVSFQTAAALPPPVPAIFIDGHVNVRLFGALGETDDTAAFNTAVTVASALGQAVFVPPGDYLVSALAPLPYNTRFFGINEHTTTLKTISASADVLTVAAGNVKISGIGFDSAVTRTSGRYVRAMTGASDFMLSNFRMQNPFIGFSIEEGTAIMKVRDGYITGVRPNGAGGKIGEGTGVGTFAAEISSVVVNAMNAPHSVGLLITNAADVILTNMQLLDAPRNLLLQPGSGQSITSLKVNSGYIDTSSEISMAFSPTGTGIIQKVDFNGTWFQGGPYGVILIDGGTGGAEIDGVTFANCEAYNSTSGSGLAILGRAKSVRWLGGKIAANAVGVYIATAQGYNHHAIQNALIGSVSPYAGNGTGIQLDGLGDQTDISGNDVTGNTTPLVRNNTQPNNRISGNIGYNDVPVMTGITVGASPFTMPTYPYPTVAHINGGNVSLIRQNGVGILQSSGHSIYRPPNSTMEVIYTSTPNPTIVSAKA